MLAKFAFSSVPPAQCVLRWLLVLLVVLVMVAVAPAVGLLRAAEFPAQTTPAGPAGDADSAVRAAVAAGNAAALRAALAAGGHAIQSRKFGVTLLMDAAEKGDPELVDLLLGAGAPVDAISSWNETALAFAIRDGNPRVIARLIEAKADVNHRGKFGFSPLIVAIGGGRLDIVGQLLTAGADPNQTTEGGGAPLLFAAVQGRVEIAGALLAAGARLEARDETGRDALAVAVEGGHEQAIAFFEQATGRKAVRPRAARVGTAATEVGEINFLRFVYQLDGRAVEVRDGVHASAGPGDLAVDSASEVLGDLGGDGQREAALLVRYRSPAGASRTAVIVFAIRDRKLVELARLPRLPNTAAGQGEVVSIGIDGDRLRVLRESPKGGPTTERWRLAGASLVPAQEP